MRLLGKVAIVTGGSGVLCSGMARALAKEGASVAIIGRNVAKLEAVVESIKIETTSKVCGYSCDVTDKLSLESTYEIIRAELGPCDILINGAGGNKSGAITSIEKMDETYSESDMSFWNLSEDAIREVYELNYMGTVLPVQVFTKDMVLRRSGTIINIASVAAILPLTKVVAYGNAKSSIISLTQWLATHFGKSGIRCNAIAPGFYAAEQNHDLLFNKDGSLTDRAGKIIAGTPMGRFGNPEDLIGPTIFLADEKASGFVNGVVLPVDGGYSAFSGV